jgi:hypothetical protein
MKSRATFALLLAATILAGLGVRSHLAHLPAWFSKPAGDILYATAVVWLLRLLFLRRPLWHVWLAAFLFCLGIEFLKFYRAPWMLSVRGTTLGRLVLGVGFHVENIACYAFGVLLAAALEILLRKISAKSVSKTAPGVP